MHTELPTHISLLETKAGRWMEETNDHPPGNNRELRSGRTSFLDMLVVKTSVGDSEEHHGEKCSSRGKVQDRCLLCHPEVKMLLNYLSRELRMQLSEESCIS